jgi:pimeloyl-ACP methyl ester carboxylesterase
MTAHSPSAEYVTLNGIRLCVERAGSGTPLVLIPGLGAGNWLWHGSADRLARHFSLVMPELRGSARSDKPDESYTIEQFAQDVLGVLDHYDIEHTHVLGASMGGFVAQCLAARAPARVRRLVLVATSLGGQRQIGPPGETLARTIRPRGRTRRERFEDGYDLGFTPRYRESNGDRLQQISDWRLAYPQPEWAYYRQVLAGWAYDGVALAESIVAPTLICAATADPVVPIANAHALRAQLRDARVAEFAGRHLFFLEHPTKFCQTVGDFLRANGAG